ncbi:LysR substrate-binding domain-containing protein [Vreelandella olivaria]|uniref:LysR substrate-binding domain-containing protein n=1 Tax=Vreelandella olivaria TaxID=390919 RepID=UPI0024C425A4|nr:LysR substrate-binding domain-containing protein [Halomonas olivaria]
MRRLKVKNLNRLRSFEASARLGGFAAAAEALNVTPAAVSQQIRSFENEYGVELFLRLPNSLALTNEGRTLLPRIADALKMIDEAVGNITTGKLEGTLTINVAPSFALHWLLPRIDDFIQHYPQISLTILADEMPSQDTINQLDLRIVHGSGNHPYLDSQMLLKDDVFPVMTPELYHSLPVTEFSDLMSHVLLHDIRVGASEASMRWQRWFEDEKLSISSPRQSLHFGNATLMLEAASQSLGVALGRSALVHDYLVSGKLIAPLQTRKSAEHAYYTLTTNLMALSPRVIAFRSWLNTQVSQMSKSTPN